jgi:hypothetical protein
MFQNLNPIYTHRVTCERYSVILNMWVRESFRTTEDAVELHRKSMKQAEEKGLVRKIHISHLRANVGA